MDRILTVAAAQQAGGAWSLTGPYGSGKSSLALLLDALLGPDGATRDTAVGLVEAANPDMADLAWAAHDNQGTQEAGFHRGLVTAAREPLNHTVLRGLHSAVLAAYDRIPSTHRFSAAGALKAALSDAASEDPRRTGPSPAALIEVAKCLASDRPLFLVIDEFGKNLEAIADSSDGDPYLLQQLAEAGQGSGLPIFLMTLQHLSFEDYLSHTEGPQRREWAKVQGRFESMAYVESASQTRAFIGTVFQADGGIRERIVDWAERQTANMRSLGISELSDPELVGSCYPLHPLAAAVLPELCNRYGQHERTLFSFLTSADPASAATYLNATEVPPEGDLPAMGLDHVYDYFVASGTMAGVPVDQSRWTEIATRLRDAPNLNEAQRRLAKAIAILNLVSTTGVLRASKRLLAEAESGADALLPALEAAGVVTYRDYSDEYRIWQGTDVDISRLLSSARREIQGRSLAGILSGIDDPKPVVAARHSAENDLLRVFVQKYVAGGEPVEPLDPFSHYDGEALLVVGSGGLPHLAKPSTVAKPVVAAVPEDLGALDEAARELAAVKSVLEDPAVEKDWVARQEVSERLVQARTHLDRAIVAAFGTDRCRWTLLAVTSQGAKARRILLEGMIERGDTEQLGLEGYGPEVAMYRAFLVRTGLHGLEPRGSRWTFRPPTAERLQEAWKLVEGEFDRATQRRVNLRDIYASLLSPPVGMKSAVIPVFVTAALLVRSEDIAVYEHGTFIPVLTPELSERMVRNPGHFEVKHFANTTGARLQVVEAIAERLGVRPGLDRVRVANVLGVVGQLVARVQRLDAFTRRTESLRDATVRAREALFTAVEPDELLFKSLPKALRVPEVLASATEYPVALYYATKLVDAVDELAGCADQLLDQLFRDLLDASGETSRDAISGYAKSLEDEVLDPDVRSFVLTLANDTVDTDADWVGAIATVLAGKAPSEWTDRDRAHFRHVLDRRVDAFQRLVALHADQRADGGGPFKPFRVTITRPDGREHVALVGVDDRDQQMVIEVLDSAMGRLVPTVGSERRGLSALIAVIAEQLLPSEDTADDDATIPLTTDTVRNA
ncbi:MAG: hypothetical protein F4187_04630 [Gemmatimonadetes bacterium]|nr:hypothetical protein [Gemmatimonadota bacterium]